MTDEEIAWINSYHERVRSTLMPLLSTDAQREWLTDVLAVESRFVRGDHARHYAHVHMVQADALRPFVDVEEMPYAMSGAVEIRESA